MAFATEHTSRANSGFSGWIVSLASSLRDRNARRRVFKQTYSELASLSTRELNDLGLSRSMIRRVAWQAAYEA